MQINLDFPKSIFSNVSKEVDSILKKLGSSSGDEQVSQAKNSAMEILGKLKIDIDVHIAALERHSEWDTFTIAFYGETNAGKSTIIETLRIMLREQSKVEAQQAFKVLQNKLGVTEEKFETLRQSILQDEKLLTKLQEEMNDITRHHDIREGALKDEIRRLNQLVAEKKRTTSFWQNLLNIFRRLPEQKENKNLVLNLKVLQSERNEVIKRLKKQQLKTSQQKIASEKEHERLKSKLKKLETLADGGIIGNGRSDYTVETQNYTFEAGGQKFALLDVPGIEGKESKVIDNIWSAVQRAHAVFYVTGKAAAPQKGDEGTQGTLEKIKEHLGSQTEVWTIFNKRITNPLQLEASDLLSKDEWESLQDLDSKMREQLGENYQKVIPLSVHPAFLTVANCLLPGSPHAKSRSKFLSKFNQQELLLKSNVVQFHALLTDNLVKDYKVKIRRSNFNKANQVVKAATTQLAMIQRETFQPLKLQLRQDTLDAGSQLDIALRALKTRLESRSDAEIYRFKCEIRKEIYRRIKEDISNDLFKCALADCIQKEQADLEQRLPQVIESELKKFQSEISEVIERFQQYANELIEAYGKIRAGDLAGKFNLKINVDNGLKVKNLLVTLIGGAFLLFGSGGWALVAGVTSLLVSLGKAVWGFFSTDYKMAQQRKSADKNLEAITEKMRAALHENLATAFPELEAKVEGLKEVIEEPARQVAGINAMLLISIAELTKLSNNIEELSVGSTSNGKDIRSFQDATIPSFKTSGKASGISTAG
jgi:hypothetical protein